MCNKRLAVIFAVLVVPIAVGVVWQQQQQYHGSSSSSSSTDPMAGPSTGPLGSGQMFDRIAGRYDMINRVLALRMDIGWRGEMTGRIRDLLSSSSSSGGTTTAEAAAKDGWRVLDVATGTADVTLQLARDLPAPTTILGLDPSANMLSVGRAKIGAAGLDSRITLRQADARDLSHVYDEYCHERGGRCFDAVTMAFGIRNVPGDERQKALCELHRLLHPGRGVLGILEFSEPTVEEFGVMGWGASLFIRYVVPFVGGVLSGAPREYWHLQRSIEDFPSPRNFQRLLQTLECPVVAAAGDGDVTPDTVGYFEMEEVRNLNFGSVQLYIGRATVRPKHSPPVAQADVKLPPIGTLG
jgi:demethylmenaquinone methyltransferase/2-methoxy-6-polyprenyl-1,4-benzoquinol methylase